mmetsp:Transcript_67004/g.216598  ORF Transcript_67004/g.216598 Transcript_67004/m.216598 type:complete len:557 (+) Transcript_67004:866-2536(+)
MRLLDLVEQHQAVGSSPDRVRELALLVVADVAWWAADELGDSVFLHVLTHVQANHGLLLAEVGRSKRLAQLGLPDACRAAEDERGDGAVRVLEAGSGAAHGLGHRGDGLLLSDDTAVQRFLQLDQARALVGRNLLHRDTGPLGDDCGHICLGDQDLLDAILVLLDLDLLPRLLRRLGRLRPSLLGDGLRLLRCRGRLRGVLGGLRLHDEGLELRPQALLLRLQLCGELVVLVAHGLLLLRLRLPEIGLDLLRLIGQHRRGAQAHAGARLVEHVDGLVGQEAVSDVLRRELHAGLQGLLSVAEPVVLFILAGQPLEDLDCLLRRRLGNVDRLETALQGLVLLDVLAVLLDGGRADDLQLAAGQGRLHDVAGVHGAAAIPGAAGTDNGVDLVDHQDDVTLGLGHLLDDVLESFLELTSVLGACEQAREVELNDLLAPQELWNVSVGDALRKTLGDRGLANAGLADEHRVVLLAARQNLNGPLQLLRAANHGVQLAVKRSLREVFAELLQHRRFAPFACSRLDATGCHSLLRLRDLCQLSQDLFRHLADVHAEPLQDLR